jgi:hypothetical protein
MLIVIHTNLRCFKYEGMTRDHAGNGNVNASSSLFKKEVRVSYSSFMIII